MANYNAGDVIRLMRNATGISQEELSDGICSVETLSRIENGKHKVKQSTYAELMAKMERDTRKNYALCVGKDMELLEERIQLEDAVAKHDYEKADRYLCRLRRKIAYDKISRQYVERLEGVVDFRLGRIDAEEYVKKMEDTIRITVPDYEKYLQIEGKERAYPFTELELLTLITLAIAYGYKEKPYRSIQIYNALLICLEEGYMDADSVSKLQMVIRHNYIKSLEQVGKYQEALEEAKRVLLSAVINNYGKILPDMLVSISWNMRKIYNDRGNNIKDTLPNVKKMLRQAYYIAAARNDYANLKMIKKYYFDCFGEIVE